MIFAETTYRDILERPSASVDPYNGPERKPASYYPDAWGCPKPSLPSSEPAWIRRLTDLADTTPLDLDLPVTPGLDPPRLGPSSEPLPTSSLGSSPLLPGYEPLYPPTEAMRGPVSTDLGPGYGECQMGPSFGPNFDPNPGLGEGYGPCFGALKGPCPY